MKKELAKVDKESWYASIFFIMAFVLPLISISMQKITNNNAITFVLYGIEAASPSIAAVIVLVISKSFNIFVKTNFHRRYLFKAVFLPVGIVCFTMFLAKWMFTFVKNVEFSVDIVLGNKLVIIFWALIAEEIGWRGYLQSFLNRYIKKRWLVPLVVGGIWSLWHYHYFILGDMDVPIIWFILGCIVESYIYSYLLVLTYNNLISAMMYHFAWNLFIHIFEINPNDNGGNPLLYIMVVVIEILIAFVLYYNCKKKAYRN